MMARRRKKFPEDPVEIEISDLSHDGRGVGHLDGKTVFIHGALPGERVTFKYTAMRRRFDEGKTVEVLEASADRVTPKCPNFGRCGGCVLQHMHHDAQIATKQSILIENLQRLGKVSAETILPPLVAEPWGYRRRARMSARYVYKKERMLVGFRERGAPYVCDMQECHILIPEVGMHLPELTELLSSLDQRDQIPQIEVAGGDDAIVLILRHMKPLSDADRARLLAFQKDSGHFLYLQSAGPDSIQPLTEEAPLFFSLPAFDLNLRFNAANFVQINATINQLMIQQAVDAMQLTDQDRVLDLFCGLGNFSLPLATQANAVVGIEGDKQLVELARENATRNGLDNTRFEVADLTADHSQADWMQGGFSKVLIDPPRSGAQEVLPALAAMKPERIVYVSCHPGSLARDAGILVEEFGYQLSQAGVMDMFPHTAHVESMAVFIRPDVS